MFQARYWPNNFWQSRYWPKTGAVIVPPPPPPAPAVVVPIPNPFTLPLTYDWSQLLPASKFISKVGYNADQTLLLVQFANGTFTLFSGVVSDIAESFRASGSPDYFYGNSILNKFTVVSQTSL